jgi:diacylglycerol kinase (ATP)
LATPPVAFEVQPVKLCTIINPKAGSIGDLELLRKNIKTLKPNCIEVTARPGDAKIYANEALRRGCDYVVAAGGDGTLNEVINGIARKAANVRLGLIPLGTGNDFARCLNLPSDIEANIALLRSGETIAIDLVRVRSDRTRYFVNVSAGGFSGMVNEKLTPEIKRTWGPLAYLRSAAAAFPELRAYRTSITLGEKETFSLDLYNAIIANGRFVGGGLPIAPEADPADGLLDVILIPERPKAETALLAAQILLGKHVPSNGVTFRRTTKLSIKSRPGMWFNIDGELVGNEPATFEVVPSALHFVAGKK